MGEANAFGGYEEDPDDSEGQQKPKSEGGGLRKQLEDALARLKEAETKASELESWRLNRERSDLLAAAGVPKEAHEFYSGEATEEAVAEWVKAKGSLFGLEQESQQPATQDPNVQDMARVQQAQAVGNQQGGPLSAQTIVDDTMAKIKQGAAEADVDDALARLFQR